MSAENLSDKASELHTYLVMYKNILADSHTYYVIYWSNWIEFYYPNQLHSFSQA